MKFSVDSPQMPNNISLYFEAFLRIFLATMVNIGRENIWNPKFNL